MYEKYNELFFDELIEHAGIKIAFGAFHDTSIFERYMLNTAQFSAAKSVAKAKQMQALVFDEKGIKGYDRFKRDVQAIQQIQNETWLRVEYEMQRRQAVKISQFSRFQDDADLYPYWVYRGRMDGRERPEHVSMEGKVFRIGDPAGDSCFPPIDWNCRCTGDQQDDRYLRDKNVTAQTTAEAEKLLEDNVHSQFRYNPAVTGPLPTTHSYFDEGLNNANGANGDTFGKTEPPTNGPHLTGLQAKGLHYVMNIIHSWRADHHVNLQDNIVFQNRRLYANVVLTNQAALEIAKHHRGVENLPRAIENPDEVWSMWTDPEKQRKVLRSYILLGCISYVVLTEDANVLDAFPCSNSEIKKYRKGVYL